MSKVDEAVQNLIEVLTEEHKAPPKRMVKVEGWVYCNIECGVHEDSLDPYNYGEDSACTKAEHRPLFAYSRKWDTPGENL